MPKVTHDLIDAGESGGGGWNMHQLELLGIEWPPRQGWKDRVVGKDISEADAAKFIALKGVNKKERRRASTGQLGLDFDQ